jgi:hypothetical protein
MNILFGSVYLALELFARAGGGGSSGGGGGSSGGGSYGGSSYNSGPSTSSGGGAPISDALAVLLVALLISSPIIALVFRYIISKIRKSLTTGDDINFHKVSIIIGVVAAFGFGIGISFINLPVGIAFVPAALLGVFFGSRNWKLYRSVKLDQKNAQKLSTASGDDKTWDYATVKPRVEQVFTQFQTDWGSFNLANMQTYLTPSFYQHNALLLEALKDLGRQDTIKSIEIQAIAIKQVADSEQNDQDRLVVDIKANISSALIEVTTNDVIDSEATPFTETWYFARQNDQWVLADILPATADRRSELKTLRDFASQNNMYYKLDIGRLLLPKRGQLFDQGKFSSNDINNHIIGRWDDLLVQLYTLNVLIDKMGEDNDRTESYLVGQISLPKSYGGILIRRTDDGGKFKIFGDKKPSGYEKVELEWGDFNKRYNVYATNLEQVTVFELLNPQFMLELHDFNLPINIEVVDNVVYFYCKLQRNNQEYSTMLNVLKRAYKELKR